MELTIPIFGIIIIIINIIMFFVPGTWKYKIIVYKQNFNWKKWYTLFTYGFLHNNIKHLTFNMIFGGGLLLILNSLFNWWFIAIIYLLGIILGGLFSVLFEKSNLLITSGASGGIYALMSSSIILFITMYSISWLFIAAALVMLILTIYQTIHSFKSSKINEWGHVGGLIAGLFTILGVII